MVELAGHVETAAGELKMTVPHRPVLGSLPRGQVNAWTILVPGTNEHIVLFESQMFLFALLLSKAVSRAQVVAALWTRTRPAILAARAGGVEAARSWRG